MTVTIHLGDCLAVMKSLPSDSVDCVVTSPPYWGLRQYFFDKAVVLRSNLSLEERNFVEAEIERLKIPRRTSSGQIMAGECLPE